MVPFPGEGTATNDPVWPEWDGHEVRYLLKEPEAFGTVRRCARAEELVWAGVECWDRMRESMKGKPLRFVLIWTVVCLALITVARAQETERRYLSGHGKDDAVPWRFFCTSGAQSGYWTNIPVPWNWELRGFGELSYQRDPTNAPVEQGRYQHDFETPATWAGKRVFLVFEGSMTDTRAAVNGESVGPVHQGSFYRFKYEVTKLLKPGATNRLEVTVDKRSANESVNRAERQGDYWLFGGIFRPVYLEAVPETFVERVAIDARADGSFAMRAFVNGAAEGMEIEAQILDTAGTPRGTSVVEKVEGGMATLKTSMDEPQLWTAETPNLYVARVRLKRGNVVVHEMRQRFGFRTMEVRDGDGLYVNGRRVILKGCDRHSAWPNSGRALSEGVHRLDIRLMKGMNMNAVRMSHYPPDAEFLDLCDELGLYVLDELGGWHWSYDTEVGRKLVEEMVTRDVNHPCVLFWDNGNEGGWNRELDGDFAKWDVQGRRVLHPWEMFSGVNASHYLSYEKTKVACEGLPTPRTKRETTPTVETNGVKWIYMPTEFLHGLFDGGAGAGLEDYWEVMRKSAHIGGGFIWAFLDEGVKLPESGKIDVAGNRAPDGIVGPYRQMEGSYYTIKEVWSPVVVLERSLPDGFAGELTVENRYSFINTRECGFHWELWRFVRPGENGELYRELASGSAVSPDIAPGGTGKVKLELPKDWTTADALVLRMTDPQGWELWTYVWALPKLDEFREVTKRIGSQKVTASETNEMIVVQAGDLILRFNKSNGRLSGAERGVHKFSLSNGPRPAVGDAQLTHLETRMEGKDCVITGSYTGDLESVTWRVRGNGWVQCDYKYRAEGPKDFMGVAFDYPEQLVRRKRWLGGGPYRVWKNRMRGSTLAVWDDGYNNTITGWSGWEYPEFKGCFANVRWMRLETVEGPITAVLGRDDMFVQVLNPEFPPKEIQGKTGINLPKAGLAFLDAIPPMGSKFRPATDSGPEGQPAVASGEYAGEVSFWFGE